MKNQDYVLMTQGKTSQIVESEFSVSPQLKPMVYTLSYDERKGVLLTEFCEKFEFNFKIYDLDDEFINHAISMMPKINHNIGVLLSGVKGTGKTIAAKIIANYLRSEGCPVIIVSVNVPDLEETIVKMSKIQSCVWFFDEFEKVFSSGDTRRDDSSTLLPIMDGTLSGIKQYFLLTTNRLSINENFLSRPGRIRWVRTYRNLSKTVVVDYLKDNLNESRIKELDDIVDYVSTYSTLSIDLLKTVCEELNLCNGPIEQVLQYINVDLNEYLYNAYVCDRYGNPYDYEQLKEAFHKKLKGLPIDDSDDSDDQPKPYSHLIASRAPVRYLKVKDYFDDGLIIKPLSKDNIITCRDGEHYYHYYILNPDKKCETNWESIL